MNKLFLVIFVAALAFASVASAEQTNQVANLTSLTYEHPLWLTNCEKDPRIVQYCGSGVYYFKVTSKKLPSAMADFLKDHPTLEVAETFVNTTQAGGFTNQYITYKLLTATSYFITFKEKK